MQRKPSIRARQGEATRAGIISAARQHFATEGYERATIRAIAADAGIDPSLVMRYFGNKQGLFVAAADIDLRLPDLGKLPPRDAAAAFVRHFLLRWEEDDVLPALLRTAATNEGAAQTMRSIMAAQAIPAVAAACNDPKTAPVRAALIASQFLGFAYCRYVLKAPPAVAMSNAAIVKWLGPTVHGYLFSDVP